MRKQETVEDATRFKLLIISSLDMGHEDHSEGVADGVVELGWIVCKCRLSGAEADLPHFQLSLQVQKLMPCCHEMQR